ncbi:MAG: biopolymer transporter ExbD [Phycisphaerae bacterium]|nr:biopolymer transporter ExbD [Phycisphaerae bacterium]
MKRRHLPSSDSIPNLAPMVDVIMVLLVFFLIGASFNLLDERLLKTELDPNVGPGGAAAVELSPRIRVRIEDFDDGKSAKITLMDRSVPPGDFAALRALLAERRDAGADVDNPVIVAPDSNVRWNFVIQAMDAVIGAGFGNVQFALASGGK